jgi:hypothetical protein
MKFKGKNQKNKKTISNVKLIFIIFKLQKNENPIKINYSNDFLLWNNNSNEFNCINQNNELMWDKLIFIELNFKINGKNIFNF